MSDRKLLQKLSRKIDKLDNPNNYDLFSHCIIHCESEKFVDECLFAFEYDEKTNIKKLKASYFSPINWGTFLKPLPKKKETFIEFLQRKLPNLTLLDNY